MRKNEFAHIKGFFFDLDGTLIDTAPDFVLTINQLRKEYQLAPLQDHEIRPHVSTGAAGLIKACMNQLQSEQDFETARQQLLSIYGELDHPHSQLFPGAAELLDMLDAMNIPWGIVTNKPEKYATPLIKKLGLDTRSVCLLCPDHVKNKKPDPESLYLAASMARLSPVDCLYFGDHDRDILAGRAAGMLTASVGFGYIPPLVDPIDWKADFHFDTFLHIFDTFFTRTQ